MAASAACRAAITLRSLGPMTFHSSSLEARRVLMGSSMSKLLPPGPNIPPPGPPPAIAVRAAGPSTGRLVWADAAAGITRPTPRLARKIHRLYKGRSSSETTGTRSVSSPRPQF
jgi:hypothetical protein